MYMMFGAKICRHNNSRQNLRCNKVVRMAYDVDMFMLREIDWIEQSSLRFLINKDLKSDFRQIRKLLKINNFESGLKCVSR